MLSVALCLICHDRPHELDQALESAGNEHWDEILVVDMASEPPLPAREGVRWLRSDENRGVAYGRNLLAREATADVLVFLDDDAVLLTPATARVRVLLDDAPALAIIAFAIRRADGTTISREAPFRGRRPQADQGREAAYFLGGAHAIRRRVMLDLGGYDERFFYDGEETDLSFSLLNAGHRIWFDPDVVVEHRPAKRGRVPSPRVAAVTWRNRLLIARRHLPWGLAAVHLGVWAIRSGMLALRSGDVRPWLRAWSEGMGMPVQRQAVSWSTLWKAHRLGGRALY